MPVALHTYPSSHGQGWHSVPSPFVTQLVVPSARTMVQTSPAGHVPIFMRTAHGVVGVHTGIVRVASSSIDDGAQNVPFPHASRLPQQ